MRIRRVELTNFRGVDHTVVEFSDGITVVEGDNEVGKSSIVEALRLLRDLKASARPQSVRAVQPVGRDVGPEVRVDLDTGDYSVTYRKRWLKQPETELTVTAPRREQHTSDTAHERFLEILRDTVDFDLLTALDTRQGTSLEQPNLASIVALHQALDGADVAQDGHDALLERVEDEFARYFTATGRPNKIYLEKINAVSVAEEAVEATRGAMAEVEEFARQHEAHTKRAAALAPEIEEVRDSLTGLEERAAEIAALGQAVDAATRDLDHARGQMGLAQKAHADRAADQAELATRRGAVAALAETVVAKQAGLDAASSTFRTAEQSEAQAAQAHRDAHQAAMSAARALDLRRRSDELASLRDTLSRAESAEEQRKNAALTVDGIAIDADAIDQLSALETKVLVARSARDAAAPEVRVTRHGEPVVSVDGEDLPVGETHATALLSTIVVDVPGIATVEVHPGAAPKDLDAAVAKAESDLAVALEEVGATSVSEARNLAERRRQAQRQVDVARSTLAALTGKSTLADLRRRQAALETALDVESPGDATDRPSTELPGETATDADNEMRSTQDLEKAARDAADAEESLRAARESAAGSLASARSTLENARAELIHATAAHENAVEECSRIEDRIEKSRTEVSDEALAAALDEARQRESAAASALSAAKQELAQADGDALALELDNARQLVARKTRELSQETAAAASLDTLLNDRSSKGLFDQHVDALATLEQAQEQLSRANREADAIKLLRDTLVHHRDEAQRRYVAPFKERIERLGRHIFGPSFEVEVSTDLMIESRTLDGATVPFGSLSAGAREQVALLGRLACAALDDPDRGAPLILDDTFGFADPDRLRAINVVLNSVGKDVQIILLTCQPDRFRDLGSAETVRLFGGSASRSVH